MLTPLTEHLIALALDEDAGLGDVTSRAIFSDKDTSKAYIQAKEPLVICGLEIAARVFAAVDPALKVKLNANDGDRVKKGEIVLQVSGPTIALLTAERTALNFLQRLSGVATQSRKVCCGGHGHRRADSRYPQDYARLACARKIRGAVRRLLQSSRVAR